MANPTAGSPLDPATIANVVAGVVQSSAATQSRVEASATSASVTREPSTNSSGTSEAGRPTLEVSMDEVRQLRILGFSWTKIAELLNISRRTLYRRVAGSGIMGYTDITAQSVVLAYKLNHPNDGEVMTIGHLRACQIHVPRSEIRSVIHRVDSKSRHGFSKSRH